MKLTDFCTKKCYLTDTRETREIYELLVAIIAVLMVYAATNGNTPIQSHKSDAQIP